LSLTTGYRRQAQNQSGDREQDYPTGHDELPCCAADAQRVNRSASGGGWQGVR
jgi:hypothetical protein